MAGDEGWAEPVEIVDGGGSTSEVAGGRELDWHQVARTAAAVVGALSLLWIGRSMAAERDDRARAECAGSLANALWRYENAGQRDGLVGEPPIPLDIAADLIAKARGCGDDVLADALEYEYVTSVEPDD